MLVSKKKERKKVIMSVYTKNDTYNGNYNHTTAITIMIQSNNIIGKSFVSVENNNQSKSIRLARIELQSTLTIKTLSSSGVNANIVIVFILGVNRPLLFKMHKARL